jgi:hypothetical protein
MKIIDSEIYESLGAEFQYQLILKLRDTLRKHGVPAATAKEICGDFVFDLSMLLDQEEIEFGGKSYQPIVGFSEGGDEPNLIINDGGFQYHEYAFGSTDEAFDLE